MVTLELAPVPGHASSSRAKGTTRVRKLTQITPPVALSIERPISEMPLVKSIGLDDIIRPYQDLTRLEPGEDVTSCASGMAHGEPSGVLLGRYGL